MTSRDDDRAGRRARVAAGVAGLAAALAGGAGLAGCKSPTPTAISPMTEKASPSAVAPPASAPAGQGRAMWPTMPQRNTSVLDTVESSQRGSLKDGGIVRVVSARGDLTGQLELAWVAGGVEPYRNAECTQQFRLHNDPKPTRKPNLLLCWRTSAGKSVIAVLVDPKGKPSKAKAVRELERKWRTMQ